MMYLYTAYGLTIQSARPLPELAPGGVRADVLVHYAPPRLPADLPAAGSTLTLDREAARLRIAGVGEFVARQGREIIVTPLPEADQRGLEIYVVTVLLPIILYQRRLLVLHASAVAIDGVAVAFVGQPGQGKSSTAAALFRQGHPLLGDDVLAVDLQAGHTLAWPGFPQIKLHGDVAATLGYTNGALQQIHPLEPKRSLSARQSFVEHALPLQAVFVLERGERTCVEPLQPAEALITLIPHLYVAHQAQDQIGFTQLTQLVQHVPILRLRRALNLATLPELVHMIEDTVASLGLARYV